MQGKSQVTVSQLKAVSELVKTMWEDGEFKVPVHLAGGNEKQLIEIFKEVKQDDYVFSTHRNMYHAILSGIPLSELLLSYKKDPSGSLGDKGGCMCINSDKHKFYSSAIVGGNTAMAAGTALGIKLRKGIRPK